jgi:hypothetical protein
MFQNLLETGLAVTIPIWRGRTSAAFVMKDTTGGRRAVVERLERRVPGASTVSGNPRDGNGIGEGQEGSNHR